MMRLSLTGVPVVIGYLFGTALLAMWYVPSTAYAFCYYPDGTIAENCNGAADQSIVPAPQNTTNTTNPQNTTNTTNPQNTTNSQTGQGYAQITNPLNGINSVSEFIRKLLSAIITIGIPIAVLFIILAGFKFITAQGNSEDLATARRNFLHVVIGVGIFIGAWALAELIVNTLRAAGIPV